MPIEKSPYKAVWYAHEESHKEPGGVVGGAEQLEGPHHGRARLPAGFIRLLFLKKQKNQTPMLHIEWLIVYLVFYAASAIFQT